MAKKKYIVEYDREGCIGAAACVVADPKRWKLVDDGKADLKGSEQGEDDIHILEISEDELDAMIEAAKSCPARVISIKEKDTGKQIV